jgi:universal stress protein F
MYNKILIPVDLGREKNAIKLCRIAMDMGNENSQLRLVSVAPGYGMSVVASFFPPDAEEKAVAEMLTLLSTIADNNLSGDVSVRVRVGKRAKLILEEAENWEADLIVVGSRRKLSRDGHRVLGACSGSVADRAPCAVLIVR